MNTVFRLSAAAAIFALLAFSFGYLGDDLTEARRWFGCILIMSAMAVAWSALMRLAEDWPRAKPKHNADLAFAQVALSVAMLAVAFFMGGRVAAALARWREPLPQLTRLLGVPGDPPQPQTNSQSTNRRSNR